MLPRNVYAITPNEGGEGVSCVLALKNDTHIDIRERLGKMCICACDFGFVDVRRCSNAWATGGTDAALESLRIPSVISGRRSYAPRPPNPDALPAKTSHRERKRKSDVSTIVL